MNRQELEEKAIFIAEHNMEIVVFNTAEEIRSMAESASDEALTEFVSEYEAEYGKLVKYRVEFFHIGSGMREITEEWLVEEDGYPDLTVTDYMENTDLELPKREAISGIIITLFIDGKPVSCVWWHKVMTEEFDTVFELTGEERN